MQPKRTIIDFDDLCDSNDPYDTLMRLHERDNGFKVTLFAIPTRLSDSLLAKYESIRSWCALGVHGWRHARHECLGWTSEETEDKVARSLGIYDKFAPIFKAPNWEIDKEVYAGLSRIGFIVADHVRNIEIIPSEQPNYTYNKRLRSDPFNKLHGHIQPWAGTGLTENPNEDGINPLYVLPVGTAYSFCTEAVEDNARVEV